MFVEFEVYIFRQGRVSERLRLRPWQPWEFQNPVKIQLSPGQTKKAEGYTPECGAFLHEDGKVFWVYVIPNYPKELPQLLGLSTKLDAEIAQNLQGG